MKQFLLPFIAVLFLACSSPCPDQHTEYGFTSPTFIDSTNTDLVCGGGKAMLKDSKITSVYKEKTYKFCSTSCQKLFLANPSKYVK